MGKVTVKDALNLSIPERIELVEDIWDTIADNESAISLTDNEKAIIDERLEDFSKNPDSGSSWDDVKKRILDKK